MWKSKRMSEESIENVTTSDNSFDPTLINYYPLPDAKFNGHCLINNISICQKVISIYIYIYIYVYIVVYIYIF